MQELVYGNFGAGLGRARIGFILLNQRLVLLTIPIVPDFNDADVVSKVNVSGHRLPGFQGRAGRRLGDLKGVCRRAGQEEAHA